MTSLKLTVVLLCVVLASGCASRVPNRSPIGETFPTVAGESLEGQRIELPLEVRGKPAIILVGYVQQAQFDGDRWLLGLMQAKTPIRILEVPTIKGMVPGLFAGVIDGGMRKGIPSEDWASVVTLYGADASRIVEMTGNSGGSNMRVMLLDAEGRVRWFHDRGYSASKCMELDVAARHFASLTSGTD